MNSLSTMLKPRGSERFAQHYQLSQYLFALPLFTAILIEAHVRFTSAKHFGIDHIWLSSTPGFVDYFLLIVHLLIQSLPLFLTLGLVLQKSTTRRPRFSNTEPSNTALSNTVLSKTVLSKIVILTLGFIVYPLLVYIAVDSSDWFARFNLLSLHFMGLAVVGVGLWALVHYMNPGYSSATQASNVQSQRLRNLLSTLFSLNSVVVICLFTWAFIISGAFHYHEDPMNNMPINLIFDPVQIVTDPLPFLNYFWQFVIISVVMGVLYLTNRYVLIKRVLNVYGVFYFVLASVVFWLLYTPIAGQLVIHLPMTPAHFTFIPSENFDVFDSDNYKVSLLFLFLTTPLILAFERQRDVATNAEIAEQKTQAELQLLQQQINPHFLFNSMNSLYALTLKKSELAPDFVMHLSNLLRYTVYEGQQTRVRLEQEVQYLQDYIALQQARLGDRLTINTKWPESSQTITIAPLLFVVILENAFKHGAESLQGNAQIDVSLTVEPSTHSDGKILIRFECCNSFAAKHFQEHLHEHEQEQKQYSGVGLSNLKQRLALLYPNKHTYKVSREKSEQQSGQQSIQEWRTTLEITL